MCGFIFTPSFACKGRMHKMLGSIRHRGTQRGLEVIQDGLEFGHVRLPIQGISSDFDQPYTSGDLIVLFVGEIFNYKKIDSRAQSDVTVLIDEWKKYGLKCFEKFDGFWSVIIYDRKLKKVFVVTDILAKKPLYIHLETFSIASEIKPLLILEERPVLDPLYISSVHKWGYHIGDRTPFNGIRKIGPNQCMVLNLTQFGLKYDSTYYYKELLPHKGDLRKQIEESVENRLVSDIDISLLVSGGLDSSIIYKLIEKRTHNFTIFHIDNDEDEFLNYLNIPRDLKVQKLTLDNVDLKKALFYNESPVDLGSVMQQYALSKAIVREGINVCISGDGADELFGGYRRITEYDSQYSDIFEELVYYHLPRLDKLMMANTVELRCPYLSRGVIESALALSYKNRINKQYLKDVFKDIIPKSILERKKKPLKNKQLIEDPIKWRRKLIKLFQEEVVNEYY